MQVCQLSRRAGAGRNLPAEVSGLHTQPVVPEESRTLQNRTPTVMARIFCVCAKTENENEPESQVVHM